MAAGPDKPSTRQIEYQGSRNCPGNDRTPLRVSAKRSGRILFSWCSSSAALRTAQTGPKPRFRCRPGANRSCTSRFARRFRSGGRPAWMPRDGPPAECGGCVPLRWGPIRIGQSSLSPARSAERTCEQHRMSGVHGLSPPRRGASANRSVSLRWLRLACDPAYRQLCHGSDPQN